MKFSFEGGSFMADNKAKECNINIPVEKHDTAAWADIEKTKPISQVAVTSEIQAKNAKEWVDTNEK